MTRAAFESRFWRAYRETLRILRVPEQDVTVDPVMLGRRVALLVASSRRWEHHLGPLLGSGDFQRLSGLSRQALHQAVVASRVVRLTLGGSFRYPAFQVDEHGRLIPGLKEVLPAFAARGLDSWTAASWLVSPHPALNDEAPATVLRSGGPVDIVRRLAEQAAARLSE